MNLFMQLKLPCSQQTFEIQLVKFHFDNVQKFVILQRSIYTTFFHMELFLIIVSEILRDQDNHISLSSSPASIARLFAQCRLNLEAVMPVLAQPWGDQYPRASLSTQPVLVDISWEEIM